MNDHLEPITRKEAVIIENYLRSTNDPEKWNYIRILIRLNLCEVVMNKALDLLLKSVAPSNFTEEEKQAWTDQLANISKLVALIK